MKELLDNQLLEMRRGTLVLAVLRCLHEPMYGYALLRHMEERQVPVDASTLYPLLRRLESQGWLQSDWDTSGSRPRKYYRLSQSGERALQQLTTEWKQLSASMTRLLEEND